MNEQFIMTGVLFVLITVGLCGCTQQDHPIKAKQSYQHQNR